VFYLFYHLSVFKRVSNVLFMLKTHILTYLVFGSNVRNNYVHASENSLQRLKEVIYILSPQKNAKEF